MPEIREGIRTFVTWQKTLLFFQICILIGLGVEIGIFFSLLYWGRPVATDIALVLQFFQTCAIWIFAINSSVYLFWWVTRQGRASKTSTDITP